MRYRFLLLLAASAALTQAGPAAGAQPRTYYVSPTGDDAASGLSPAHAWQTVNRVDRASLGPGDSVLFRGGATFRSGTLIPPASGTAAAPIRFASYGHGRATIDEADGAVWFDSRSYLIFDRLTLTTGGAPAVILAGSAHGSSHITVSRCVLRDTGNAGINSPSTADSDWLIENDVIRNTGDSGIIVLGAHATIRGTTIDNVGRNTALDYGKHGIYAKGPDMLIADNTISRFPGSGVSLRYRNARVVDNTIRDGKTAISFYRQDPLTGESSITGNTLTGITVTGFYYDTGGHENFVVSGNRIEMSGGTAFSIAGTPTRRLEIVGNVVSGTKEYAVQASPFAGGASFVERDNTFVGAPVFDWAGHALTLADYQQISGKGQDDRIVGTGHRIPYLPVWLFLAAGLAALAVVLVGSRSRRLLRRATAV